MWRRRSLFGTFLIVGFGVFLGAAIFGGPGAVGTVLAAPLVAVGFVFKIFLFFMLFGLMSRLIFRAGATGGRGKCWSGPSGREWSDRTRPHWHRRSGSSDEGEAGSKDDRFEEWHRMAHARQEVDDHTPPFVE